jgi:drug/metabolite transporter (DMT)-like permease
VDAESPAPYLWMLCGSFSFAWMGALAHVLGPSCDWRVIALARAALPLLLTLVLACAAGVRLPVLRPPALWLRSGAGSVSMLCTFYALTRLPTHVVLAINNTFPIWVAILAWPILGHKPPPSVWVAVLTGVAGVVLIQRPFEHEALDFRNVAALIAVAATLFIALAMIGLYQVRSLDPRAIIVHFSGVALVVCLGSLLVTGEVAVVGELARPSTAWVLLLVGLAATAGQVFLTKAYSGSSPTKVSIIALSQIVFALFLDLTFGERDFHPLTLLGVVLVIAPTAWVIFLRTPGAGGEVEDGEP